ncbi:acid protease [Cucurbitaria berberidis CBS 394.84]|uniref:Acid protease n=1 Tax=Cucurbitaria berberidis CBS 394.84 TaxID=1168544 RepID=A0A9P4GPC8_9PLEO|nr:acid protease [Cucurbitaria berberidis CBS 394.84]KAF1848877.1 acid protease [Cucurbitaria berberidis CBS 394.84]
MIPSQGRCVLLSSICALVAPTLLLPCLAAEYVQQNLTDSPGFKLLSGISSVPAPIRVAPDQDWMGTDGAWNTFSLLVGDPPENVRVLVSTASQQTWVINRQACVSNITDPKTGQIAQLNAFNSDCETSRGFLYNNTDSKTWRRKGYYQLWLEKNLGLVGNGLYGFDSVGLGLLGEQGPSVQNTTIGTLVTANFWLGHIGLHPKPTNFSAFENPIPSYLSDLFTQKKIPSLSFGYTAGAQYHGQTVLGSLTLGGYDASRFIPNDLTFILAPDNERDLVVGVVGLTASTTTTQNINLLKRDDVTMFIDSTVAELWLPVEICKAFEEAFGLKHDAATDLYLVDDALHQNLMTQNPSVTFTLGQKYSTATTLQITLSYAAFDLQASPPYRGLQEKTKYFPIRRGNDSSQWVLGRTFLQEAYLTVDWERQNFSLSAIDWTFGKQSDLVPIVSPQYAVQHYRSPKKPGLSTTPIIGIAVGGGFTFALIMCAIGWWFWRRRHKRKLEVIKAKYEADVAAAAAKKDSSERSAKTPTSPVHDSEEATRVFPKAELPSHSATHHELGTDLKEKNPIAISEADNTERPIYEMPGDMPERQEAGGRQLSEKETMVVRERMYNGIDPNGSPLVSPLGEEPPRRLVPISPSEVTTLSGRHPSSNNVSPVTPRTPRDGAHLETTDTFFQLPPYRPPRDGRLNEDILLSPISPLEGPTDTSRRRFSYES